MSEHQFLAFPQDFIWGAATSAYQIEGACGEGGRGASIWDTFAAQRGKIRGGDRGDMACDHYHRYPEDVELMSQLGLKAYRFSLAWPRVLPTGTGAVNQAGLDFYSRLVDALLAKNITPMPTLFHWDLPQALQDKGGWTNRETAKHFAEYARIVGERLGDRVSYWITHNEPWVAAFVGHLYGEHAPGLHSPFAAVAALHHLLLSHGYAVEALRSVARQPINIGITLNLTPVYPARSGSWDERAARFSDAFLNRMALDPVLKGAYPAFLPNWIWRWLSRNVIRPDDLKTISVPLDFLGINYYHRTVMRYMPLIQSVPVFPKESEYTEMRWEIYPTGLYDLLLRLQKDYAPPAILITENGAAFADEIDEGKIHDTKRILYLRDHLVQLHRAIEAGVPVRGYFIWSLLDNFEWAHGYSKRFGLVYVDFQTQRRVIKDSGLWYAQVIREHGVRTDTLEFWNRADAKGAKMPT